MTGLMSERARQDLLDAGVDPDAVTAGLPGGRDLTGVPGTYIVGLVEVDDRGVQVHDERFLIHDSHLWSVVAALIRPDRGVTAYTETAVPGGSGVSDHSVAFSCPPGLYAYWRQHFDRQNEERDRLRELPPIDRIERARHLMDAHLQEIGAYAVERATAIRELRGSGMSVTEIADALGVTRSAIYKVL